MYRIKQRDSSDCAVASLLSIIKYYKGNISYEKLRNMMKCNKNGVNAYDLVMTAKKIGFKSEGIKCNYDDLKSINTPFIAHVTIKDSYDHYVVVEKIDKLIKVNDPYLGLKKYNRVQFENIWNNVIITFKPSNIIVNENNKNYFYINLLKRYKKNIIVLVIISLMSVFLTIISTYYIKMLMDNVNYINKIFISFSILLIIRLLLEFYRNKIMILIEKNIDIDLMFNSYKNMLSLQEEYFINRQKGDVLNRFNSIDSIKTILFKLPFLFFVYISIIVATSILLINISLKMYIISMIFILVYFLVQLLFFNKNKHYIKKINEEKGYINGYLSESIDGITTIKNYNISNNKVINFNKIYNDYLNIKEKYITFYNLENILKSIVLLVSFNYILYIGIGILSSGNLILFYMVLSMLIDSIKNVFDMEEEYNSGLVAINRLEEIINNNHINGYYCSKIDKVTIKNIFFAYKNNDYIIKDFSYQINRGDKVLLLGNSGSGKTTLFHLLLKYMKVDSGNIYFKEEEINNWNIDGLRENVTYVCIDDKIFRGRLVDNICFGDIDINKLNKIVGQCKLSIGINSYVDENGTNISLGERSKLLLCRALYKNSNILIIDELLSNISVEEEHIILSDLINEYKEMIIIYTSHRNIDKSLFNKILNIKERGKYEILK